MAQRMSSEDKIRKSQEEESRRQNSMLDAYEFIKEFVKEGWESHLSSININCNLTLEELHKIGHLPKSQGTRECRKLIRVPVINDEIGSALWEKLATMARGDEAGNIDDTEATRAWERERKRQEINAIPYRQKHHRRSSSPPPQSPKRACILCPPSRHLGACALSEGQHLPPSTEPVSPSTEAPARKLSWILPGRRRSSAAAKSPHSPKPNNEQWEEGFWQQQRNEIPSPLLKALKSPEVTEEPVSGPLSPRSPKGSFPKRILRKISVPHILSNIGEFGESLGVGYGSREQGPVMSPTTPQLPYLRPR